MHKVPLLSRISMLNSQKLFSLAKFEGNANYVQQNIINFIKNNIVFLANIYLFLRILHSIYSSESLVSYWPNIFGLYNL